MNRSKKGCTSNGCAGFREGLDDSNSSKEELVVAHLHKLRGYRAEGSLYVKAQTDLKVDHAIVHHFAKTDVRAS
eukprot:m.248369 g.248369  ORF g.248369 m.248369 type:complete len:74 (-) comp17501_c1_seq6:30-251(-)